MRNLMNVLIVMGALVVASNAVGAENEIPTRNTKIVLQPGDSPVVNRNQVKRYECAEGVLVAYDWGSRLKLRCQDGLDARAAFRGL